MPNYTTDQEKLLSGTDAQRAAALNAAFAAGAFNKPTTPASAPLTTSPTTPASAPLTAQSEYERRQQAELSGGSFFSDTERSDESRRQRALVQARIDAINAAKQAEINRIREATRANLTTEGAGMARRGLAGSSFASGRSQEVENVGARQEGEAERKAALEVEGITAQADKDAQEMLEKKREALKLGSAALIDFNSKQKAMKQQQVAAAILNKARSGTDITTLDTTPYESAYGLSNEEVQVALSEAYKQQQTEEKANRVTLGEGQSLFTYNPKTGKMERTASVAKTYAPKTGAAGVSPTTGKPYANDMELLVDQATNTIKTKFGQSKFQESMSKARNDADKIQLIATQAASSMPADMKKSFSDKVSGIKAVDRAIAALDNGLKTGRITQGKQYVMNLAGSQVSPEIAKLKQDITLALQPYRTATTGAAWGAQEDAEYQDIFGNIGLKPEVLKQRLQGVRDEMSSRAVGDLSRQVSVLSDVEGFRSGAFAPENVRIQTPDGRVVSVPSSKVDEAVSRGGKIIQ